MVLSNCITPVILADTPLSTTDTLASALENDEGEQNEDKMSSEVGVIAGASGSALVSEGKSTVLCAVHGPRATQKSTMDSMQFECDISFAQFANCPSFSTTLHSMIGSSQIAPSAASVLSRSSVERLLSDFLRESLVGVIRTEQFPKTTVSLYVTILQSSGNIGHDLATAITCGSLALADSSVEMLDLVAASTVTLSMRAESSTAEVIGQVGSCDPMRATSHVTIASRRNSPELTQLWCEGRARVDMVFPMVEQACKMNAKKCIKIEETIVEKLKSVAHV